MLHNLPDLCVFGTIPALNGAVREAALYYALVYVYLFQRCLVLLHTTGFLRSLGLRRRHTGFALTFP